MVNKLDGKFTAFGLPQSGNMMPDFNCDILFWLRIALNEQWGTAGQIKGGNQTRAWGGWPLEGARLRVSVSGWQGAVPNMRGIFEKLLSKLIAVGA